MRDPSTSERKRVLVYVKSFVVEDSSNPHSLMPCEELYVEAQGQT